jgi:hypothetical protein
MNHKKLRRLYREERLQVRRRSGRKRALGTRAPLFREPARLHVHPPRGDGLYPFLEEIPGLRSQVRMSSANDAPIGVSPLAGKPATPAMLVDVPKLLTAFFIGAGAAGCVRHLGPSWVPL